MLNHFTRPIREQKKIIRQQEIEILVGLHQYTISEQNIRDDIRKPTKLKFFELPFIQNYRTKPRFVKILHDVLSLAVSSFNCSVFIKHNILIKLKNGSNIKPGTSSQKLVV